MVILIVDDDYVIVRYLADVFQKLGHESLGCIDGVDAFQKCLLGGVDVLVTDHMMPRVTGIALLEMVKVAAPQVRRVLHTACSLKDAEVQEALKNGTAEYALEKACGFTAIRNALLVLQESPKIRS